MVLSRPILVTMPLSMEKKTQHNTHAWKDRPFKLQIGTQGVPGFMSVKLSYAELSKIISDGEAEIRDYLGDEE